MINKLLEFFEEGGGPGLSNMRLNSTIIVIVCCACLLYMTLKGFDVQSTIITLVLIAMGMKVIQKFKEGKLESISPREENKQ